MVECGRLTQYASGCGRRSKCEHVMRLAVYDTNALIRSPPPTVTTPTFTLEKGDLGYPVYRVSRVNPGSPPVSFYRYNGSTSKNVVSGSAAAFVWKRLPVTHELSEDETR